MANSRVVVAETIVMQARFNIEILSLKAQCLQLFQRTSLQHGLLLLDYQRIAQCL